MRKTRTDRLEESAKSLKKEGARIDNCRAELGAAWEGESSELLRGKMKLISEELLKAAAELEEVAEVINKKRSSE